MMKRIKYWVFFFALPLIFTGCEDDSYNEENDINRQLIVEAFVFPNEPIRHVKLAKLHADGLAESVPVANANVQISQNDSTLTLVGSASSSGIYEQADTSWFLQSSGDIQLKVEHQGFTYRADTRMPPKIQNLQASSDKISIGEWNENEVVLTLSWDPVETEGYCIFVREVPENATPVTPVYGTDVANPFMIINETHTVELRGAHFSHYGSYEIYVSAANSEYINAYSDNEATDLVAAPSNIRNGWGVFTAFNGESINITVE
jgi:hypothetical protein